MALNKEKTLDNGTTASYWKIVDCDVRNNNVMIALYNDQEHAQTRNNMLSGRTRIPCEFDIEELEALDMNPLKYAYTKAKESKMSQWYEGLQDEEGNEIAEGDFVSGETNWFADTQDC